jgi:hypothetical protein
MNVMRQQRVRRSTGFVIDGSLLTSVRAYVYVVDVSVHACIYMSVMGGTIAKKMEMVPICRSASLTDKE